MRVASTASASKQCGALPLAAAGGGSLGEPVSGAPQAGELFLRWRAVSKVPAPTPPGPRDPGNAPVAQRTRNQLMIDEVPEFVQEHEPEPR
jgi:hypothetical protein